MTIAKEDPLNKFSDEVRREIAQAGYTEVVNLAVVFYLGVCGDINPRPRGERSGFRQAPLDADRAGERCNASIGLRADSRRLHQSLKNQPFSVGFFSPESRGIRTLHVARQGRKRSHFVAFSVSEGHIINVPQDEHKQRI